MHEPEHKPGDVVKVTALLADDEKEGLRIGDIGVVQGLEPERGHYPWDVYFWRIRKQRPMSTCQMHLCEEGTADGSVGRPA